MTLNDELALSRLTILSRTNCINEQVREVRLHSRMEMNFRLFKDDDRASGHIERFNDHRQDLTDAKADIRQFDFRKLGTCPNEYLVFLAMRPELFDLKVADESHKPQTLRDEFSKRPRSLFRLPIEQPSPGGQDCLNGSVALYSYMIRSLA